MRVHDLTRVFMGLHLTSRNKRRASSQSGKKNGTLKIARGVYLEADLLAECSDRWQQRAYVLLARILAAHALAQGNIIFGHYTAMFLNDVPMRFFQTDVWARMERGDGTTLHFPEVIFRGEQILPAGKVRLLSGAQIDEPTKLGLVRVSGYQQLLLEMAVPDDFEALVCASSILSTFVEQRTNGREKRVEIAADLRERACAKIRAHQWIRQPKKALRMIEMASGQCESGAEAAMYAILRTSLPKECSERVIQQKEIVSRGRRFFLDFALPHLKIGFEVEGLGKNVQRGLNEQEAHQAFCERNLYISGEGWDIYPFAAKECLYQPDKVKNTVSDVLTASFVRHRRR